MKVIRRWLVLHRCRKVGLNVVREKKINKMIFKLRKKSQKEFGDNIPVDFDKLKIYMLDHDIDKIKDFMITFLEFLREKKKDEK